MAIYKQHTTKPITEQEAKTILSHKESAYHEYIAARVLFNAGCLQQACVFANTAIQKEIKAYLHYHGLKAKGHDIFIYLTRCLEKIPMLEAYLIGVLSKWYIRYITTDIQKI